MPPSETPRGDSRDLWQRPTEILAHLALKPGQVVIDAGAGTGYFAFALAHAVTEAGRVLAVDREIAFVSALRRTCAMYPQIEAICGDAQALNLGTRGRADALLACNLVHQLDNPRQAFTCWRGVLAAGARVVIVDFEKRKLPVGPPEEELVASEVLLGDLKACGYAKISVTHLVHQYLISARVPA